MSSEVGSGTHRRRIGPWSAAALVVANMIGTGLFTTSGFSLGDLGRREWVLLAWAVGGVVALIGALCYGALARRMPESGGEYYFLARTAHPLVGFLAGWVSLCAGFTAPIAIAGLALQEYASPWIGEGVRPEWIGTAGIAGAALLHGWRTSHGVLGQNLAVAAKLLLLATFFGYGVAKLSGPNDPVAPDPTFSLATFAITLVWISFAYSGWNAAVYVAGEVREPERNLQRTLVAAAGLVTLVYLAVNAVFLYSAPVADLAGRPDVAAVAAEALGGTRLRDAVSALIALALLTSISSMVMIGPRVYARMAEDGLFPSVFSYRGQAPAAAVALQAALAIVVVWVTNLRELLGFIGFTLGLSTAATVCALMVLRRREGPDRVPVPGYPWLPAAFVLATLGSSYFLVHRAFEQGETGNLLRGLLVIAAGLPIYWTMRTRVRSPGP